jgi:NADH:ubiquinone oxidoreductase subunit 3 (subunit A)
MAKQFSELSVIPKGVAALLNFLEVSSEGVRSAAPGFLAVPTVGFYEWRKGALEWD